MFTSCKSKRRRRRIDFFLTDVIESKKKKMNQFEDLPDEIILLICRYLDQFDILNSFTRLNLRLSQTINEFTQRIDLNLIPLKFVDYFQNEIFPSIDFNVRSLILNDDFQRFPIDISQFVNLESIHFRNNFSLDYLIDLKVIEINCVPPDIQNDLFQRFFYSNEHLKLTKLSLISYHGFTLTNCQLNNNLNRIEYLTINLKNNVDLFCLLSLVSSSIKHLDIQILYNGPFQSQTKQPLKLDKLRYFHLKTIFEDSIQFKQIEKLLVESFGFVECLSIESLTRDENYIDAFQWQKLFDKLIYLTNFHCSIRYRFKIVDDNQQFDKEQKILKDFSTDYWIKQRQYFVNTYSTISITNQTFLQVNNYGKLYFHTIPYPYSSIDTTIDIITAKSTFSIKRMYSNVRHLYFDGENIPIQLEDFKTLLNQFTSIHELKLDRLLIDSSSKLSSPIDLHHLNKLTIYSSHENYCLNIDFLNLSSMYNLRYLRLPQKSLLHYSFMPKQIETLILTECRDLHFDFIGNYDKLRLLKLFLSHFDRLLENNGKLIVDLIRTIYSNNQLMESLQFMCPGVNQTKVKAFEKQFNFNRTDYLNANSDGKCLTIQRSKDFFQRK